MYGLRYQWIIVWGLFLLSPAWGQPSRQLNIASYNLLNLFDVFDDPYTRDEQTRIKPHQEIGAVAKTLLSLNADVIALQEVENEHLLKAMALDFMPDAGYDYIATSKTNSGRGMRVGVMSRLPVLSVTSYQFAPLTLPGQQKTWHFARDLMHVRIQVPHAQATSAQLKKVSQGSDHRILNVLVVHFKSRRGSKGDPKSAHWRLAEAMMTRKVVEEILQKDPNAWVVLLGDFNDTPQNPPLKHLLGKPVLLHDMHRHLKPSDRITYLRPPYRSTIDFILASPALARRIIMPRTFVLQDKAMLVGSDHAPVFASFQLNAP